MSTRRTSKIQFEDNVIINTENIQEYLNDIVDYTNNIPATADASSWIQQTYVNGYTERRWDWNNYLPASGTMTIREAPFMPGFSESITNPSGSLRLKGYTPKGLLVAQKFDDTGALLTKVYGDNCYIFETSQWFQEPTIINDFHVHMQTDMNSTGVRDYGRYPDRWWWNAACPNPDIAENKFVEDLAVQIVIDSPDNPQDAQQTTIELNKGMFSADSQFVNANYSWMTDMEPNVNSLGLTNNDIRIWGLTVGGQQLNISVPARSRVRFYIVIPDWTNAFTANNRWTENSAPSFYGGEDPWPNTAWRLQKYTMTVNALERRLRK